jgi:MFS superfamily sulfate permease-like transporter
MLEGIVIGVIMTFVGLLIRSASPQVPQLGRLPGSAEYVDITHWPTATPRDDTLVMRSNSGWYYANAGVIRDAIIKAIAERDSAPRLVVLDMATAPLLDLGAIEVLTELDEHLATDGIALRLANLYARNHELLRKAHEGMAAQQPHLTIDEAIADWEVTTGLTPPTDAQSWRPGTMGQHMV